MTHTVDLVYFNAGGGHRAAALALRDTIKLQGRDWDVRLVNLFEVLDPKGLFRRITGIAPEDLYNKRLARGWTLGLAQELKILQRLIRLRHAALVRTLQQHWLDTEPDLVVSLVPNFNRAMHAALAGALPGVPYVTVMTDLADYPPHFWIERNQAQHLVCGSARAVSQALEAGYPTQRVHPVSGMILRPAFHAVPPLPEEERRARRTALGLAPDRPTGLVMFGGQGSAQMATIARELADQQLILLCGQNAALARRLDGRGTLARHVAIGFTQDVAGVMQLADYFIGKPGPGSLSEAVHMGLPVITFLNSLTMPQERYNAQWVTEQRLGIVLHSTRGLRRGVLDMIQALPAYQASVQRVGNRAVFEVVEVLAGLLGERAPVHAAGDLLATA